MHWALLYCDIERQLLWLYLILHHPSMTESTSWAHQAERRTSHHPTQSTVHGPSTCGHWQPRWARIPVNDDQSGWAVLPWHIIRTSQSADHGPYVNGPSSHPCPSGAQPAQPWCYAVTLLRSRRDPTFGGAARTDHRQSLKYETFFVHHASYTHDRYVQCGATHWYDYRLCQLAFPSKSKSRIITSIWV
jgi:hypothetical protein